MCFFFFKQKTAYEFGLGLVGSEMDISDRRFYRVARIQKAAGECAVGGDSTGWPKSKSRQVSVQWAGILQGGQNPKVGR